MKNKLRMITEATLIVGVDIAKKIHWSQVTDYRGNALCKPIKVENTFEGFQEFLHVIKEICGQIAISYTHLDVYKRQVYRHFTRLKVC